MAKYRLTFSNSNNRWYTLDSYEGTEVEMLKYANEILHNLENKFYNLWIYDENDDRMYLNYTTSGCFHRGKKIEKLINLKIKNR